jgi:GGDEF domain-containing protein
MGGVVHARAAALRHDANRRWHRPIAIGNGVVARLLGEEFILVAPRSPPTPEEWEPRQMIDETTCCTRQNVRMR